MTWKSKRNCLQESFLPRYFKSGPPEAIRRGPSKGSRATGKIHPVFALLLVFAVGLGAVPVLRHTQNTFRLQRTVAALLDSPMRVELQALPARISAFEKKAMAFHQILARAEGELWYYRGLREPALILKDFGGRDGEIGAAGLEVVFRRVREEGIRLLRELAVTGLRWRELRENPGEPQFRVLAAGLEPLLAASARHATRLQGYGDQLASLAGRVEQLQGLGAQVADSVPPPWRELPAGLAGARDSLRRLRRALPERIPGFSPAGGGGG